MKGKKVSEISFGGVTVSVQFTDETGASFFIDESIISECIDYKKFHEIVERLEPEDVTDLYLIDQNGNDITFDDEEEEYE